MFGAHGVLELNSAVNYNSDISSQLGTKKIKIRKSKTN